MRGVDGIAMRGMEGMAVMVEKRSAAEWDQASQFIKLAVKE